MEKLWKAAFVVSGVAGIAFFVFWSLYRNWLKLGIFEKLSQDQTFWIMIIFLILVFLALVVGIFAFLRHPSKNKNSSSEEVMIYQAAFLLHGISPPSIEEHISIMTNEIKKTKDQLHEAINHGQLKVSREVVIPGGLTRWIKMDDLKDYVKLVDLKPNQL